MKEYNKNQTMLGKRILCFGLAIAAMFLAACGGGNKKSTETESVSLSTPIVYLGSLTDYALVCPENASTALNRLCLSIRSALKEKTGTMLEYKDDFVRGDNENVPGKEILVGKTDRKESAAALADLTAMDYRIRVDGEKVVIVGGSDLALEEAVKTFIAEFITGGNAMVPENYDVTHTFDAEDYMASLNPVLKFTFDEVVRNKTTSVNGEEDARLINALQEGGYYGSALRFQRVKKGGALLDDGVFASLIQGKSGYTVSMWIMPYQSYHGAHYFRLFSAYGTNSKSLLEISYSSPGIKVTARSDGKASEQVVVFPYALETRVPPFDAVNTNDGVWQLVTVTVDFMANSIKCYINGKEIASGKGSSPVSFGNATLPAQTNIALKDLIGGDANETERSFNGVIDEFMLFDRSLSAAEILAMYSAYNAPETPSVTEDQEMLDTMVEKLGGGMAIKGDSADLIYGKRVVKADVDDYSVGNMILDGKLYITENLASRYYGTVNGTTLTTKGGKTVTGTVKDGNTYFPILAICEAEGLSYIDSLASSSMFIVLADDSTLTKDDTKLIDRMASFCTVEEFEPTVNVEQTRTVIATSDTHAGDYTYSPSITRVGDKLYASRDISCLYTEVFRSEDDGKTWVYAGKVDGMWWATIFEHKGELYLIGRYVKGGIVSASSGTNYIGITKSTDGGVTWTEITAEQGGVSYNGFGVHCAPTPVLKLNGRLYRVFESTSGGNREFIVSADENSDLLDPNSWTASDYFTGQGFPNEGNAVMGPDGKVWILARYSVSRAFLMKLQDNGTITAVGFVDFPSTANKFTVRYDEVTGKYIAITCPLVDENTEMQRNYSALCVSDDLVNWEIKEMLLCDREIVNATISTAQHAFQYVDWIFDGDDILFVVRESAEDAANFHDSNYLTLYRIENYAELVK